MMYNRRLDGVGYDQWKLSPPPYMEDEEEEVSDEEEEASDDSADESAEIYRLRKKIAKEQGLHITDICHRCGDSRHVCRCNA